MKNYKIITTHSFWFPETLRANTEKIINEKVQDGYEILHVQFGFNGWWIPTSYITIRK